MDDDTPPVHDELPPEAPDDDAARGDEPAASPGTMPEEAQVEELSHQPPRELQLRRLDAIFLITITLLAGVVHFARLANPDRILPPTDEQCRKFPRLNAPCRDQIPLDEWHYLPDARDVIVYGTESDQRVPPDDGAFVVHPPVGKWFIALGIRMFGDSGFGWRFSGALFGTLAVAILYLFARRLWGSPILAGLAGLLLGVEGLWFVMSRVAMLDIYMSVFILAGVWLLVEDRARTHERHRGVRWWRIGSGIAFGLALATKWGAIPFYAAALALAFAWELRRAYRDATEMTPDGPVIVGRPRVRRHVARLAGSLVLIPVAVYLTSYLPWFTNPHRYNPPRCEVMDAGWLSSKTVPKTLTGWIASTGRFGQWVCYQREYLDFHLNLDKFEAVDATRSGAPQPVGDRTSAEAAVGARKPAHPYFGDAWSWPWAGRPVAHYYESNTRDGHERIEHILGLPNVAIWWPAFAIAIPLLIWWAWRKKDPIAILLLAFIASGWVPYLYADIKERPVFLFYALPMIPFLVLGIVHVFARMLERYPGAIVVVGIYACIAVLTFGYFYPVLSAYPLAREGWFGWSRRMWFYTPHLQIFGRYLIPGDCNAVDVVKHYCWI